MYTLSACAVCAGLVVLIGAVLFAGCAALVVASDVGVVMAAKVVEHVRLLAARALSARAAHGFGGSDPKGWTNGLLNHALFPARGFHRTR